MVYVHILSNAITLCRHVLNKIKSSFYLTKEPNLRTIPIEEYMNHVSCHIPGKPMTYQYIVM